MEETFYNLLSIFICFAPFCGGALILGLAAFFIIRTIGRQVKPPTAEQVNADGRDLQTQVGWLAHRLAAWTPDALADLSTDWDAKWSRWGRDLKAHGTLPSVARPKEISWVAFGLRVRGASEPDGILHARTSGQTLDYRFTRGGVAIRLNGAPFGQVRADGVLLDAQGRAVGEAKRPGGMPVVFRAAGAAATYDARESSYPLILEGITVARIAHPPLEIFNVIEIKKQTRIPALEMIDPSPAQAAEWALALAVLQAAYHLFESVWTDAGGIRLKRVGKYRPFRFR